MSLDGSGSNGEKVKLNQHGKPIQRRSTDGCQNCKASRVKCDRGKPMCGCCVRRGEQCNYSKIVFNGINRVKNDRRTGRKSVKAKQADLKAASVSSASIPLHVSPSLPQPDHFTFATNVVINPVQRRRSISIGQLLSDSSEDASPTPQAVQDPAEEELQVIGHGVEQCNVLGRQGSIAGLIPSLSPEVSRLLSHRNARLLLDHYMARTVATIHPQQGAQKNNSSTKWFLPIALRYPVVLESILALSGAQLSVDRPEQQTAVLSHKSSSIAQLNQLIRRVANDSKNGRLAYTAEMMAAILTFITLAVSESGTATWELHCQAARNVLKGMSKPEDPRLNYVYFRLLKYVCFAEIARPTLQDLPELVHIQDPSLDAAFGVPSLGLKLSTMISRYAYKIQSGISPSDLAGDLNQLDRLLAVYMQDGAMSASEDDACPEWRTVQDAWRYTVVLFYHRTIFAADLNDPVCQNMLAKILHCMRFMSLTSIYGTALAFTMLTISPLIRDWQVREWFSSMLVTLAASTKTGNFLSIREFARLCWHEIDEGRCQTQVEVNGLAEAHNLVILAA
ncbi:fungal-specific transcription factor domain-domain-containing protein [Protomyces lactucae-debilis]|uniref:Fungal-specific transcription factor domain-domain-containing protein n=1 Tax=Protomyces lactucae-debilis TaxID=2754530 RepID=A0A1Y2FAB7_PROLT|nr:fungal-specific transcription factor domain-containing protein [Protomyces lactucae-debilis]ORY79815.1 fungal-specific transcription factor domain-domain-containing protein [Protomyces lactucae-debilis]